METVKENMDAASKLMEQKNLDWVHVNVGGEGTGKSALALEIAQHVDPEFTASQVVFDSREFISKATELEPGKAIVFDEGIEALYSRNAMKKENKQMVEFLRQCRELNLFIIINMPSWREMDKSIRFNRTKSLARCVKQGWAHFYSRSKLKNIKTSDGGVNWPNPDFKDSWPDPEGNQIWENYKQKKQERIKGLKEKYLEQEEDQDEKLLNLGKFAEKVGVSRQTINNWCNEDKIEYRKLFNGQKRIPESQIEKVIVE